ncbi:DUF7344 domain-containing protein [Natronorubrum sp. FCH18a]|uniref:DUF7344 domain-containing protein n=1 Tax=Natronorubrum sp. FCH18a TaxID=3447018 RepID=UPI003F512E02
MAPTASPTQQAGEQTSRDPEADDSLEPDDIYHILQTRRRRDALRYLRANDDPVLLSDLAEQVAAWEHETTVENLHSDQRQRVYISLYQSHLPKLDTRGIIDYDKDRGTITSTSITPRFDPYLAGLEASDSSDPWPYRYAGAVGCCGLFLAVIASGIVAIPWLVASVFTVLAFAAVTAAHVYAVSVDS